jgi:exonuclease III
LGDSAREIERIVLTTEREEMDLEMEAATLNVLRAFFPHAEIRRYTWWKTASMPKFERTLSEKGRACVGLF